MPDIRHLINIQAKPEKINEAVSTAVGMAAWWTTDVAQQADNPLTLQLHFGPDYFKILRLEARDKNRVVWKCLQADKEWVNTDIIFNFREDAQGTKLFFEHTGWGAYTDLYSQCSFDWTIFLRSLKAYVEKGKGKPFPDYQD